MEETITYDPTNHINLYDYPENASDEVRHELTDLFHPLVHNEQDYD